MARSPTSQWPGLGMIQQADQGHGYRGASLRHIGLDSLGTATAIDFGSFCLHSAPPPRSRIQPRASPKSSELESSLPSRV